MFLLNISIVMSVIMAIIYQLNQRYEQAIYWVLMAIFWAVVSLKD